MARNIGADGSAVYRAVITLTDRKTGETTVKHEGPYAKPAAAHGRVSFWVNRYAEYDDEDQRTGSRATGVVEKAHTVWAPAGAPAPAAGPLALYAQGLRHAAEEIDNDDTCDCGGCGSCIPRALAARLHALADAYGATPAPQPPVDSDRTIPFLKTPQCPDRCSCRTTEEPSK